MASFRLYVYGGADIKEGQCDTMYCIGLKERKWNKLELKGELPGSFSNAAGALVGETWHIICGLIDNEQSKSIYAINLETLEGRLVNSSAPLMDSHTANVKDDKVIVFGGYVGYKKSNSVYEYSAKDSSFVELEVQGARPAARSEHSAVVVDNCLVVFGGSDCNAGKLADLWKFDLALKTWEQVAVNEGLWPKERSGHAAVVYKGRMYVFGGSVELVREVNELFSWDPRTECWTLLHSNERVPSEEDRNSPVTALKVKKITDEAKRRMKGELAFSVNELLKLTPCLNANKPSSPVKKTKVKKPKLEVKLPSEVNVRASYSGNEFVSPIVKIMQNSIVMNAKRSAKELENEVKTVIKFPCGRDGHVAEVYGDNLYVFGGDRCQMGYNDLFAFQLV